MLTLVAVFPRCSAQALTDVIEEPTHYSRVKLRQLAGHQNEKLLMQKREEAESSAKKDRALDFASVRAVVGVVWARLSACSLPPSTLSIALFFLTPLYLMVSFRQVGVISFTVRAY